jgi:hypothetical protein
MDSLNDEQSREIIAELAELLPLAFAARSATLPGDPFGDDELEASRLKWDPVFTGGGIVGLLLTDPAAPPPSRTKDIDLVLEIANYYEFVGMEEVLRKTGFTQSTDEHAVIVAWKWKGVRVDFLPHEPMELMKSNRWFPHLVEEAERVAVTADKFAWRASAPCFIATKFEAFYNRGNGDYAASKDIEDIIAVIDGRIELLDEIEDCSHDVRGFVSQACRRLLEDQRFMDILPNLVPDDQRETIVEDRLRKLGMF